MEMNIKLNSLYICVQDMDRAITFYENFLGVSVFEKDIILSKFRIHDFYFCLFDNNAVNEKVTWGDNCLPSFEVEDINTLIDKLSSLNIEIVYPLTQIKNNMVLEFKDTEGNDIEVYSKI